MTAAPTANTAPARGSQRIVICFVGMTLPNTIVQHVCWVGVKMPGAQNWSVCCYTNTLRQSVKNQQHPEDLTTLLSLHSCLNVGLKYQEFSRCSTFAAYSVIVHMAKMFISNIFHDLGLK